MDAMRTRKYCFFKQPKLMKTSTNYIINRGFIVKTNHDAQNKVLIQKKY